MTRRLRLHGRSPRTSAQLPPAPGVAARTSTTRRTPRARAAIEADLREIPAQRARARTGDPRADQLFGAVVARRADRLLDELLRCRSPHPGRPSSDRVEVTP